ncbi:MAG: hypothetical protein ACSHYA_18520 [Opitutaceae bacterium]
MNELTNMDEAPRFAPVDETELDLCHALWTAVALQAVQDARSKSAKPTMKRIRESAQSWLHAEGEELSDLEMVCEFAGIDAKQAQKRLIEISEGDESLDFRCLKKSSNKNKGQETRSKYLKRVRYQKAQRTLH